LTHPSVKEGIDFTNKQIQKVLLATSRGLSSFHRDTQLAKLRKKHEIQCDGKLYHEYCVCINAIPERDTIANEYSTAADIDYIWKDAGFMVDVCGYTRSATALLKLKFLGYVEVFQRVVDGLILNDKLCFARSGDIKDPLLKQLWLVKGCTTLTIEVMMKYYQSNAYRLHKDLSRAKAATAKWKASSKKAANITQAHEEIFGCIAAIDSMKRELSEDNMYAFVKLVDGDYHKYFSEKYTKFAMAVDFVLPCECIVWQYETFKEAFPSSHCMFSIMVSSERYYVELANIFRNNNAQTEGDLFASVLGDQSWL